MDEVNENRIKLSICIPSFNRPELLIRTLVSIINQTKKPYEVIVMDDASSADMSDIKKICYENNFSYIGKEGNVGLMKNFNNVLMQAKGSYVALVHNDDLLSRSYVEEIEKFINKYPNYNVYVTNGVGINEKKKAIAEYRPFTCDTILRKKEGIRRLWAKDYFGLLSVIGCTIYNTEFIQKNLLDSSLGYEADTDKALQLLNEEDLMYIDIPIYFTTLHKDQASYKNKLSDEKLRAYIRNRMFIIKKFCKDFESVPLYLPKIKTLHFLQLSLKYGYGVRRLIEILEIKTIKEFVLILWLIPVLAYHAAYKRIAFLMHKKNIDKYLY